jgi:adenylyl cyclase-associated protein
VTSRLEDLYEHSGNGVPQSSAPTSAATPAAVATLLPPPASVQVQVIEDPPSVVAYDEQILKGKVQPFVRLTEAFPIASLVEQVSIYILLCTMPELCN